MLEVLYKSKNMLMVQKRKIKGKDEKGYYD